jgi:purine-binding chemotaxis protein CheW
MNGNESSRSGGEAGVDWQDLLKRQEAATSGELGRAPAEERAIMQARALELARRPAQEANGGEELDCLEFQLSGESYAIEMSYVSETQPLADFTPLFCTPPFVLGITTLRGRILSIVDLRRFFELPVVGLSDLNRVIVVGDGTMEFGVLADAIVGMKSLPLRELHPPPATFTGIREEFVTGITADRLALLDIGKILADRRIIVHEEVE